MMKSVFFLFIMSLNTKKTVTKSIQPPENGFLDAELGVEDRSEPNIELEDRVIWKRIDGHSKEGSRGNKEESTSGDDFFTQPTSLKINENDVIEQKIASEDGNITFKKQTLSDNSLADILEGLNTIANGTSLEELLETSQSVELRPQNLSNAIVIEFSNITGDAIVLDVFNENSNFEDLDEVSEMTKGEEIAFLHEMPTSSFEFLIDAQTRRNILLKELLGSQTILSAGEDDTEISTLHEDDHPSTTMDIHSRGNNFEELTMNDTSVPVGNNTEVDGMAREGSLNKSSENFEDTELINSSENILPECPQPGWCIFWFISQDTCAVNSHCLGSRICCKTGCSKTCVDI